MDFHHSSGPNQVINEEDSTSSTITTTITQTGTQSPSTNTIRLRLQKKASKTGRRVSWTNDTVDNEMLNKKSPNVVVFTTSQKIGMKVRPKMRMTTTIVYTAKDTKKAILIANETRRNTNIRVIIIIKK